MMNPVQQKIPCVYVTGVTDEVSNKRNNQTFKVSATSNLTAEAQREDLSLAKATEKLDGTCCLVKEFQGQPWLWARHDRKPSKAAERRFTQFKKSKQKSSDNGEQSNTKFVWNLSKDFKEVPPNWIPASRLEVRDGEVMPDSIGHTPGWIPVDLNSRQQCWHLSAVNLSAGLALVLRETENESNDLVIEAQPLSSLCDQTCELIGTNINGNPYGIGTKKCPIHFFVPHGSLTLTCPSPTDYDAMYDWFNSQASEAQIEGIVWHCANGELYKLHRHHLNLAWPVTEPSLCQRRVKVQVEVTSIEGEEEGTKKGQGLSLFSKLASLNGQTCPSIRDLHQGLETEENTAS